MIGPQWIRNTDSMKHCQPSFNIEDLKHVKNTLFHQRLMAENQQESALVILETHVLNTIKRTQRNSNIPSGELT